MGDSPSRLDLIEARLDTVEDRLGIDHEAIAADAAAALERGAEANDLQEAVLDAPGGQDAKTDALTKVASTDVTNADAVADALVHVDGALERWPEDEDLLKAKADLEAASA